MKICYLARHSQAISNDDEGAIAHALRELGHEVQCIQEREGFRALRTKYDLCLIHHCHDIALVSQLPPPVVLWCFDQINWQGDPQCGARRVQWINQLSPYLALAFYTDGDWTVHNDSSKVVQLCQGADGRVVGIAPTAKVEHDLLFTGTKTGRSSFIAEMTAKYGTGFLHVQRRVYRRDLAGLIARCRIVLSPPTPITDLYWSNRVYVALGFGAFMLHPYSKELTEHYTDCEHLRYYRTQDELHELISYYLPRPNERWIIQQQALRHTLANHTYKHRCTQLIDVCKERLGL